MISRIVTRECREGDPIDAALRAELIRDLPTLEASAEALRLSKVLQDRLSLSTRASADALHIAIAAVHSVDYLLTWNCTYIANARLRKSVGSTCSEFGFDVPIICTPEELISEATMEKDEIVEGVRKIREAYAEQFDFDLDAMYRDIKKKERASGRVLILPPPIPASDEVKSS